MPKYCQRQTNFLYQFLWLMLLLLTGLMLMPAPAQAAPLSQIDCELTMTVANEAQLNNAIHCFNIATTPGERVIELVSNIDLTASSMPIENNTDGVSLRLVGATHTVDGKNLPDVRPFEIRAATVVTMQAITITRGNINNGAGIRNQGMLNLLDSTISSNKADGSPLGVGAGGGIYNIGQLTITHSTISYNTANSEGNASGGAIYNIGHLTVFHSTFNANSAAGGLGSSGGAVFNSEHVTVTNTTFNANNANSNTTGNGSGGGITNSGYLTVTNSTFNGNYVFGTESSSGGAIYNTGHATARSSTIAHNNAHAGFIVVGYGGGIYNTGHLTVTNNTISYNTASGSLSGSLDNGGYGGGVYNSGYLTVTNSTISYNSAYGSLFTPGGGAGIYNANSDSTLTVRNTIIAGNSSTGDCVLIAGNSAFSHSLIADAANACGLTGDTDGNIIGVDPQLGPLQDNDGPTFTHALRPNSPAIDAADNTICADLTNNLDQRGVARPQGQRCDIGAYEVDRAPITFSKQVAVGSADPSEWQFTIAGEPGAIAHGETVTLTVGSYLVSEVGPADYILTGASGACALNNGQLELTVIPAGGTCIITNTRNTGPVTFMKQVVGGAASPGDWSFTMDSNPTPIAHGETVTLTVGSYLISESGPAEYTLTGASGVCALVNGQIELTVTNADGTCTITNTRNTGTVTLIKQVIGGSASPADWTFSATSGPAGANLPTTISTNQTITLDTGNYLIEEIGPAEYTLTSASGVCALVNGQFELTVTKAGGTCTITNTRNTAVVTFMKQVLDGTAQPSDWNFTLADDPTPIAHGETVALEVGSYVVSEHGPAGYTAVGTDGICTLVNGQITVTVDGSGGTCTITNSQAALHFELPSALLLNETAAQAANVNSATLNYTVRLATAPSSPVAVHLTTDEQYLSVSPVTLTFTADNWQQPQTVALSAIDNAIDQGESYTVSLTHTIQSADPAYAALPAQTLVITVVDDDQAGILLTSTTLTLTVDQTATYQVQLTSQPTAPVVIELSVPASLRVNQSCEPSDPTMACLRFTPDNWYQPQTVTLTALSVGAGQVMHTVQSDDPYYADQAPSALQVTIQAPDPTPNQPGKGNYQLFLPFISQ